MFNSLRSIFESRTVRKAPLHTETHSERNGAACPSYINYHLKGEVTIMLHCQLCSTHYTTVQIKNCFTSTSAIKIATMKNTDNFRYAKGSHHVLLPNQYFLLMNGTQRRTLVSPRRMHCTYCGMQKSTRRNEATSNSEKIKPVALAIIELRLSEGISQSVTYSVNQ